MFYIFYVVSNFKMDAHSWSFMGAGINWSRINDFKTLSLIPKVPQPVSSYSAP